MCTIGRGIDIEEGCRRGPCESSLHGRAIFAALAHHLHVGIHVGALLQQAAPTAAAAAVGGGIQGHGQGQATLCRPPIF